MPYKVLELSAILDLLIDTKFTKQNVRFVFKDILARFSFLQLFLRNHLELNACPINRCTLSHIENTLFPGKQQWPRLTRLRTEFILKHGCC